MKGHLLIAGGGMIGPVMALTMSGEFDKITILEKRGRKQTDEKTESSLQIILSERGWKILEEIGLKQEVIKMCIPLSGRMNHHKVNKAVTEKYGENGETISCIGRDQLHKVLLSKISEASNIDLIYNCEVIDVHPENQKLTYLSESKKIDVGYDLLIGADGANSAIAQALNSETERICAIEDYTYKETRIWNGDLSPKYFHYYNCSNYMAGAFPSDLNGNFSLFYVYPNKNEKKIFNTNTIIEQNKHNPLIPEKILNETIRSLISMKSNILGNVTNEVWHYKNNILLMGDAAHAILPFMGQGLNLGLEDVHFFSRFYRANPSSFQQFCEMRKKDTDCMAKISADQFNYLLGKIDSNKEELIKAKNDYYLSTGQRSLYSACAFTLQSIYEIYMNDKKTEAKLQNK